MSVPVRTAPTGPPQVDVYRPLSPMALVGLAFAIASLFIFVVDQGWLLLFLAVPGLLISLLARYRIHRAEGTLAGAALSAVGIALSLVSLLGWSTKYFVTYWIVQSESREFLENFQKNLREDAEGKRAFLDTIDPQARALAANIKLDQPDAVAQLRRRFGPAGGMAGSLYTGFRNDTLWQMLLRYGGDVKWQRRGGGSWRYDQGKYIIEHRYAVSTPEIEGEVYLVATSTTKEGKREWKVEGFGPTGARFLEAPKPTLYGERMTEARNDAHMAFAVWFTQVVDDHKDRALALTVTGDTKEFDRIYEAIRAGASPGERAPSAMKSLLLLREEEKETYWYFDMLISIETVNENLELQATIKGKGDPNPIDSAWRIVEPKLVLRSKKEQEGPMGPPRGGKPPMGKPPMGKPPMDKPPTGL